MLRRRPRPRLVWPSPRCRRCGEVCVPVHYTDNVVPVTRDEVTPLMRALLGRDASLTPPSCATLPERSQP